MEGRENTPTSTPSPPPRRVRAIGTMGGVKSELAAVYRDAHAGRIPWEQATKRAHLLATLGRMIEGGELEARLAALEADRP